MGIPKKIIDECLELHPKESGKFTANYFACLKIKCDEQVHDTNAYDDYINNLTEEEKNNYDPLIGEIETIAKDFNAFSDR